MISARGRSPCYAPFHPDCAFGPIKGGSRVSLGLPATVPAAVAGILLILQV